MDLTTYILALHSLGISDWTVVVAGISIVLGTLLVLILVFYIFGAIVSKSVERSKKKNSKNQNSAAPAIKPAPVKQNTAPSVPVAPQGVSGEVVAAISAAVYSMDGANARVTSITPKRQSPITSRNPWAQAAIVDNTMPF